MNFEYDVLFDFLSEEHKKNFLIWDNAYVVPNNNGDKKGYIVAVYRAGYIVAVYRAPFQEKIVVTVRGYESRLKQKERDNKLNKLGLC